MSDTPTPDDPTKQVHNFSIHADDITHDTSAWTTEQINAMERKSLEEWSSLSDDEKRALVVIMRDCLIRMIEDPLEWLPISLKPESGMRLGIFIYIGTDSVEKEILELRLIGQKNLNGQLADLVELSELGKAASDESELLTEAQSPQG